jgi:hypothetical protein
LRFCWRCWSRDFLAFRFTAARTCTTPSFIIAPSSSPDSCSATFISPEGNGAHP